MITTNDIEKFQYIGDLFGLLTIFFLAEPEKYLLEQILAADEQMPQSRVDQGLDLMRREIEKNRTRLAVYQEELAMEFAQLFLGPQTPAATPFASFYLSETSQMMTDVTLWVRREYLDAGLAAKDLYRIPDDHIALELEFIAWLARETVDALERGETDVADVVQARLSRFSREHLGKWAPLFADRILAAGTSDFYNGTAIALMGGLLFLKDSSASL